MGPNMITVDGVMADLAKRFPRAPMEAWASTFRQVLGPIEGDRLDRAYRDCMSGWNEPSMPKPAHIVACVPKGEKQPESFIEVLAKRDLERIREERQRACELFATACSECSDVLAEPYAHQARVHLRRVCAEIARLETKGHSVTSALARYNGRERRPAATGNHPPRAPDVWIDDADRAIFQAQMTSALRIGANRKDKIIRDIRQP